MENETYYRVKGKFGVYLLTRQEMEYAIDRENDGVDGIILKESDYQNEQNS